MITYENDFTLNIDKVYRLYRKGVYEAKFRYFWICILTSLDMGR